MQVKCHVSKLIKLFSKFLSWKTLEGSEILIALYQQNFWNVSKQTDIGKGEKHLRFVVLAEYFVQQTDWNR